MLIDLHIHSKNSDGILSVEDIFKMAYNMDCHFISITDHDYIEDYTNLSNKYGVLAVPGIEFNTAHKKMHILGYSIVDVKRVQEVMQKLARHNENVCLQVIEMLKKDGFDINSEDIKNFAKTSGINCDVMNKKLIVKYLIYKGYCSTVKEAYDSLIGRNAFYYKPISKLSPKEVIELINNTGGVPVLAHPYTVINVENIIPELIDYGLRGIEAINPQKHIEETYEIIAENNKLITTYGSDFHNENNQIGISVEKEKGKTLIKQLGGKPC